MHHRHAVATLIAGAMVFALTTFSLQSATVASPRLASGVSPTPVIWTPNVSGGPTVGDESYCNQNYFGPGNEFPCQSEVYSTAYVNGDVIAAGAFTEACQPGPLTSNLCANGTQVKRDDIFAYAAGTGLIDPHFVPILNAGPAWSVVAGPPGSNTVYVGGAFTTVNTASHIGVVQLNVNPGVTSGATADGSVVKAFTGRVNDQVRDLALSPDNSSLYLGGQFTTVDGASKFSDGAAVDGLARLNAKTGALDNSFAFTLGDPVSGTPVKVEAMALSPIGDQLAFSGSFLEVDGKSRQRMAIADTGRSLGAAAHLSVWTAPILKNNCLDQHDYVRGLAYSPDGSFIVIADTGTANDGSMPFSACDAVARFDVTTVNTRWNPTTPVNVAPSWINYSGSDSFYSVAVAGGVVYAGGHNRWVNNYCGNNDVCDPNALLVDGLSAIDANTGIALAWWHPQTLRGDGTMYLDTFPANTYDGASAGLAEGTDVDSIGGSYHSEEALFPIAAATSAVPGGPIPSGLFNEEDGTNTGTPMCMDDTGNSSASGTPVELYACANDAEQNWNVEPDHTIQINGLCLDTTGNATRSGALLVLDTCVAGAATQQWGQGTGNTLVNTGATAADGTLVCLADTNRSTTSGNQLQIWTCNGSTSQLWPLPVAQGPPPPPATGEIFSREVQSNSQVPCLDDTSDSVAANNPVQLWTCTGDPEQNWTTVANGSTLTIELGGTNGQYCLDAPDSTPGATADVELNACSGSVSQQWTVGPSYQLQNAGATTLNGSAYCLVDPSGDTTNSTRLQIAACATSSTNTAAAEAWRLPAV